MWTMSVLEMAWVRWRGMSGWAPRRGVAGPKVIVGMPWAVRWAARDWEASAPCWCQGARRVTWRPARDWAWARPVRAVVGPPAAGSMPEMTWRMRMGVRGGT